MKKEGVMGLQTLSTGSARSWAINAIVYLVLGCGCIFGASFVTVGAWHDAMLVIGGILIGGFCFAFTGLKLALKDKECRESNPSVSDEERK